VGAVLASGVGWWVATMATTAVVGKGVTAVSGRQPANNHDHSKARASINRVGGKRLMLSIV
jgi:hypothetical protein